MRLAEEVLSADARRHWGGGFDSGWSRLVAPYSCRAREFKRWKWTSVGAYVKRSILVFDERDFRGGSRGVWVRIKIAPYILLAREVAVGIKAHNGLLVEDSNLLHLGKLNCASVVINATYCLARISPKD